MDSHAALCLAVLALAAAPASGQGSEARYSVRFEALWSPQTHPGAYPSGAHYSNLIGGTHVRGSHFWEAGDLASPGVELMAEAGFDFSLRDEVEAAIAAGSAGRLITGLAIDSPGTAMSSFRVSEVFPVATVVAMIAPSPDWFIGVDGVDLYVGDTWVDELVVELYAWDAGTDSGGDFGSPNQDTDPQQPITLITSGPLGGAAPMGRFTFRRLASTWVYGCGTNPVGTLQVSGLPRLLRTTRFTLADPQGAISGNALTAVSISTRADAAFPCGSFVPGFGLGGPGAGSELLIEGMVRRIQGPTYQGTPVTIPLTIPDRPGLVGRTFYVQGSLMDTNGNTGLTEAVELRVGF